MVGEECKAKNIYIKISRKNLRASRTRTGLKGTHKMCIHYRNQAEFSAAKEEKRLLQLDAQALARVVLGLIAHHSRGENMKSPQMSKKPSIEEKKRDVGKFSCDFAGQLTMLHILRLSTALTIFGGSRPRVTHEKSSAFWPWPRSTLNMIFVPPRTRRRRFFIFYYYFPTSFSSLFFLCSSHCVLCLSREIVELEPSSELCVHVMAL